MACLKRFFDGDKMTNIDIRILVVQPHHASKCKNAMKQSKIEIDGKHHIFNIASLYITSDPYVNSSVSLYLPYGSQCIRASTGWRIKNSFRFFLQLPQKCLQTVNATTILQIITNVSFSNIYFT